MASTLACDSFTYCQFTLEFSVSSGMWGGGGEVRTESIPTIDDSDIPQHPDLS